MNGHSDRIAVIIVNWNSGGLLRRCIESLSLQTLKPARVIVVDNASSDGSADGIGNIMDCVETVRRSRVRSNMELEHARENGRCHER